MNIESIILTVSLLLQIAAAMLALRLYLKPPRSLAWLIISIALILMSLRRLISLSGRMGFSLPGGETLSAETTALIISIIMFLGIWLIRPLLRVHREVESTQNENRELRKTEDRFRELLDNMKSGVVVFLPTEDETDFIITDFNRGAAQIEAISPENAIGKRLTTLFPQVRKFGLLDVLLRVNQTGASEHFPIRFYKDDRVMGWRENFVYKMSTGELVTIYNDVSEQMHITEALQKNEGLYRGLVEQGIGLVYRSLPDTTLTFVNQAYCRFFEKERSDLLGEQFINHTLETYRKDIYRAFSGLTPDHPTETNLEQINTTRGIHWVEWHNHGLFDHEGTLREVQGLGFDITERLKMEKELRQTNLELEIAMNHTKGLAEEAEMASQAKTVFLANMSHELRTPLNAVMGCTDLLNTTALSPEQNEYVKTISEGANVLLGTITEILDLAKIEAGKQQPEPILFNLKKLLINTLSLLDNAAKRNDNRLLLDCPDDLPELVKGDRQKVQQVLTNLLNNSIKFTHHGTVTLTIRAPAHQPDMIEFNVHDTGIGMTPEELLSIFKPFEQAETSHRKEGTGLGLPISSKLVEIMGGTIRVSSTVDEGSCFSFALSLPSEQKEDDSQSHADHQTGHKHNEVESHSLHVICAEDNEVNQLVTKRMLSKMGIDADMVSDGRALLEQLKPCSYNVILMDVQMPCIDGLEATREIRKTDKDIYIIGLTAFAYEKDQKECYEAGMNDFVAKPIRKHQLTEALHRAKEYVNAHEPENRC